jgi:tetratricopeptide (TPR) repeat protein
MVIETGSIRRWSAGVLVAGCVLTGSVRATAAGQVEVGNPPEQDGEVIRGASLAQRARSYKELGDSYVSDDRLDAAADAYGEALSLDREAFTPDERVEMAIYISWEDRLDEAGNELRLVLSEDPAHIGARSHLAQVYSWSGRLKQSVVEAEKVLAASPGHQDALLVKANALEWQGYFRSAIPLYRELLDSDVRFDARIGLSRALLSGGNRQAALENARTLSPASPRQSNQLEELTRTIRGLSRPRVDLRHNYYQDSDENQHHTFSLLYGFGFRNHDFQLQLGRTDSRNGTRTSRSRAASFDFTSVLTEGLSIGGAIGVTQPRTGSLPSLVTGGFSVDSSISNGRIGASVSSSVLADTTELIENRIRATSYGTSIAKPVSERFSLAGGYSYRDLSDGNHSHDVQFTPEFLAISNPRVSIGYQFRFQDYRGQTQSGYFDPDDYIANRVFSSLYYENAHFYSYVNAFAGRQEYTRNGSFTEDAVIGGAFSVGFMPTTAVRIEINGEGGNFAAGSVSGFTYFNLGSRVTLAF